MATQVSGSPGERSGPLRRHRGFYRDNHILGRHVHRPWIRLWVDIVHDEKVAKLSHAHQRHYVWLLLAKELGVIDSSLSDRARVAAIREHLGVDSDQLRNLRKQLIRAQLIDSSWNPLAWEKRQGAQAENERGKSGRKPMIPKEKTFSPDLGELSETKKPSENQPVTEAGTEMALKWHWDGTEVDPKSCPSGLNSNDIPKSKPPSWHRDGTEMALKWHQNSHSHSQTHDLFEETAGTKIAIDKDKDKEKEYINVENQPQVIDSSSAPKSGIKKPQWEQDVAAVLRHLNQRTGSRHTYRTPRGKPTQHALTIRKRLEKDGYTAERLIKVIDKKCRHWLNDEKMKRYLRPDTLFRLSKLEIYEGEPDVKG